MNESNFLICYEYIKNNLYINFGDGNRFRIVWFWRNAINTHNVLYISLKKNSATGFPVAKTLIKYNSNNLKENEEEEKEPIDIEFTEQKQILKLWKCYWLKMIRCTKRRQGRYCLANFIENYKNKMMRIIFKK